MRTPGRDQTEPTEATRSSSITWRLFFTRWFTSRSKALFSSRAAERSPSLASPSRTSASSLRAKAESSEERAWISETIASALRPMDEISSSAPSSRDRGGSPAPMPAIACSSVSMRLVKRFLKEDRKATKAIPAVPSPATRATANDAMRKRRKGLRSISKTA